MRTIGLKIKLALGVGVLLVALCATAIVSYLSVQDLRDLSAISEQKAEREVPRSNHRSYAQQPKKPIFAHSF